MIKVFVSEMFEHPLGGTVQEHVYHRMRNPDTGSDFQKLSGHLAGLSDEVAVRQLLRKGYDGIIFIGDKELQVVGDLFFQEQKDGLELHVFACRVNFTYRGCGIGRALVRAFLEHARERRVEVVRISKGNIAMMRILERIFEGEISLPGFVLARMGDEPGYARLVA